MFLASVISCFGALSAGGLAAKSEKESTNALPAACQDEERKIRHIAGKVSNMCHIVVYVHCCVQAAPPCHVWQSETPRLTIVSFSLSHCPSGLGLLQARGSRGISSRRTDQQQRQAAYEEADMLDKGGVERFQFRNF